MEFWSDRLQKNDRKNDFYEIGVLGGFQSVRHIAVSFPLQMRPFSIEEILGNSFRYVHKHTTHITILVLNQTNSNQHKIFVYIKFISYTLFSIYIFCILFYPHDNHHTHTLAHRRIYVHAHKRTHTHIHNPHAQPPNTHAFPNTLVVVLDAKTELEPK